MILLRTKYKFYTVLYCSLERYPTYVVSSESAVPTIFESWIQEYLKSLVNSCTVLTTHFVINFINYTYSNNVEIRPMTKLDNVKIHI